MSAERDPLELFTESEYHEMVRLSEQANPSLIPLAKDRLESLVKHYESQENTKATEGIRRQARAMKQCGAIGAIVTGFGIKEGEPVTIGLGLFNLGLALTYRKSVLSAKKELDSNPRADIARSFLGKIASDSEQG